MKVIFFGKLRDMLGEDRELEAKEAEPVSELRRRLADLCPEAASDLLNPGVRACVADTIVSEDFILGGNDTVEFFPPVSGG